MKPNTNTKAVTAKTTDSPAVVQERLVVPLLWRAGIANNPQQKDKRYATYDDALEAARETCDDLEVWAVWDEDDNVRTLIHLGSMWRK